MKPPIEGIYPKSGFILLTRAAYKTYKEQTSAFRASDITEIWENTLDDTGGSWIRKTNGKCQRLTESPQEILSRIEAVAGSKDDK